MVQPNGLDNTDGREDDKTIGDRELEDQMKGGQSSQEDSSTNQNTNQSEEEAEEEI